MEQQKQGTRSTPSHEAQVKGGESSQKSGNKTPNQPSHEASVKGGQNAHTGGQK